MCRWFVIALLAIVLPSGLLMLGERTAAGDGDHKANSPGSSADDGRRLMRTGKFDEAVGKLEAAWKSSSNPEVLFDLAVCYEHLDRDSEALNAFQTYQGLPMALRLTEAAEHILSLESRQPAPRPTGPPRHVLVPLTPAGEKCIQDCLQPSSCQPRGRGTWRTCTATRFSCIRGCPGARVEPGACPTSAIVAKTMCLNDGPMVSMQ
jgi:hypothetical protein